ncbi:cytochrome P450 [Ceratobasidium sp. AG-I]|nr:cytochrome P450 [Ceratobasidium sp. AG-I]
MPINYVHDQMKHGSAEPSLVSRWLEQPGQGKDHEDHVKWAAASLYSGGTDTTVAAITTFFLAMIYNPAAQAEAQAEIERVVGVGRLPTYSDRASLPYVDALYKEVLRWQPVTPFGVPHKYSSTKDDEYDGMRIPAGATIIANAWGMLQDPEVHKDPTVFNPNRFIGLVAEPNPEDIIFGFGRRRCPGIAVAQSSIWLSVALTLAAYNVAPIMGSDEKPTLPSLKYSNTTISLEVYHHENAGSSKTDHTYVVFKTDDALPILKKYLSGKEASAYWKETCNIVSGITKCPAPLIKLIESREGPVHSVQQGSSSRSTWRERGQISTTGANAIPITAGLLRRPEANVYDQNHKRNRDEVANEQYTPEPYNKKTKFSDDTETSGPTPTTDSLPTSAPPASEENVASSRPADTSNTASPKREVLSPYIPHTQKSALELAQEAIKLVSNARAHGQGSSTTNDIRAELERVEAERDEARTENGRLRAERDAEAKTCLELRQELERLKKSVKDKASKSDAILRLVTASLQSLQADAAETLEP